MLLQGMRGLKQGIRSLKSTPTRKKRDNARNIAVLAMLPVRALNPCAAAAVEVVMSSRRTKIRKL